MGNLIDLNTERVKKKMDNGGGDLPIADISVIFFDDDNFAVSAQLRNKEEPDLRQPRTVEEQIALINHLRWVANWMSARWGMDFMEVEAHWGGVRPEFVVPDPSTDD